MLVVTHCSAGIISLQEMYGLFDLKHDKGKEGPRKSRWTVKRDSFAMMFPSLTDSIKAFPRLKHANFL